MGRGSGTRLILPSESTCESLIKQRVPWSCTEFHQLRFKKKTCSVCCKKRKKKMLKVFRTCLLGLGSRAMSREALASVLKESPDTVSNGCSFSPMQEIATARKDLVWDFKPGRQCSSDFLHVCWVLNGCHLHVCFHPFLMLCTSILASSPMNPSPGPWG